MGGEKVKAKVTQWERGAYPQSNTVIPTWEERKLKLKLHTGREELVPKVTLSYRHGGRGS